MKIYITIKTLHSNKFEPEDSSFDKYQLNHKWDENTCLSGHFKSDFDWKRNEKRPNHYFGRHISQPNVTVNLYIYD